MWIVVTCSRCGQTRFSESAALLCSISGMAPPGGGAILTIGPCDVCAPSTTNSPSESGSAARGSGFTGRDVNVSGGLVDAEARFG